MSLPKIIVQITLTGGRILGKALYEAGRQAVQNAKHRPATATGEAAGIDNATSGSDTDKLTREHRMTLDEAHLVLNVKRGEQMETVLKHYEHLFKANSPRPAPPPPAPGTKPTALPGSSHYLLSKVVRAKERIEAELKVAQEDATVETVEVPNANPSNPPPPPPP